MLSKMQFTAGNWITIAILLGTAIGTWYLMQDHVDHLRVTQQYILDEVHQLKVRAAVEDSADALLMWRVEQLEKMNE